MDNTIQTLSHPCARGLYSDFYRTTSTLPVARVLLHCLTGCVTGILRTLFASFFKREANIV